MPILAGDIGGTKTHLAFFDKEGDRFVIQVQKKYPSAEHKGLEEIVALFLKEEGLSIKKACFGIAGAVKHGVCHATNLPWDVNTKNLGKACSVGEGKVAIINDLEANAWGIKALVPSELDVLNKGVEDSRANLALISAGTGLGEAGIVYNSGHRYPFASEGGHADFAPCSQSEDVILKFLRKRWKHVSYERVLSGPGIVNLHDFLTQEKGLIELDEVVREMEVQDKAYVISKWALSGKSEVCVKALEIFSSIYGSAAGNLALKMMATGGVFLGGGIAPKVLPFLKKERFLKAFTSKGRFENLLKTIPVKVILREDTALLGSMMYAQFMI